jgi:hypothetical protein
MEHIRRRIPQTAVAARALFAAAVGCERLETCGGGAVEAGRGTATVDGRTARAGSATHALLTFTAISSWRERDSLSTLLHLPPLTDHCD